MSKCEAVTEALCSRWARHDLKLARIEREALYRLRGRGGSIHRHNSDADRTTLSSSLLCPDRPSHDVDPGLSAVPSWLLLPFE